MHLSVIQDNNVLKGESQKTLSYLFKKGCEI